MTGCRGGPCGRRLPAQSGMSERFAWLFRLITVTNCLRGVTNDPESAVQSPIGLTSLSPAADSDLMASRSRLSWPLLFGIATAFGVSSSI